MRSPFDTHEGMGDLYLAKCKAAGIDAYVVSWLTPPDASWTVCFLYEDDKADTVHEIMGPRMMLPLLAFEKARDLRSASASSS